MEALVIVKGAVGTLLPVGVPLEELMWTAFSVTPPPLT